MPVFRIHAEERQKNGATRVAAIEVIAKTADEAERSARWFLEMTGSARIRASLKYETFEKKFDYIREAAAPGSKTEPGAFIAYIVSIMAKVSAPDKTNAVRTLGGALISVANDTPEKTTPRILDLDMKVDESNG